MALDHPASSFLMLVRIAVVSDVCHPFLHLLHKMFRAWVAGTLSFAGENRTLVQWLPPNSNAVEFFNVSGMFRRCDPIETGSRPFSVYPLVGPNFCRSSAQVFFGGCPTGRSRWHRMPWGAIPEVMGCHRGSHRLPWLDPWVPSARGLVILVDLPRGLWFHSPPSNRGHAIRT